MSGALPSSQTTLKPQSLSEYSAMMLPVSQPVFREDRSTPDAQLDDMESGMLQPPQKWEENKRQLQALQLQQRFAPRGPEAKSGDDRVASVAGYDTAHKREEQETLPRRQQPITRADESFLVLAQMRLPALSSDNMLVEEETSPVVEYDETVVVENGLFALAKGDQADKAYVDAQQEGSQQLEQQAPASPPLLQQQQEILAPPPQEPWPPPIMAAEHGSGAGGGGESRLELGRKYTFDGGCDDDGGGVSGGNEESDTTDGGDGERAGIGTGARSRASWGCEMAGRRLTRRRRARGREK